MIAKRTIPLLIAALVGILLIATYFIPLTETYGADALEMFIILAAAAMVLGAGNLLILNLAKISNRQPGWGYAVITLLAFFVTLIIGMFKIGALPTPNAPGNAWTAPVVQEGTPFWWIYQYGLVPLTATMFAMLAFYVASAAFRAFRAKNIEATLLLFTAFIVLLGRTYAGVFLTEWVPGFMAMITGLTPEHFSTLKLDDLTGWIMNAPNKAGNRAITIGIALGVVSYSLKILLGVDRSYLGQD